MKKRTMGIVLSILLLLQGTPFAGIAVSEGAEAVPESTAEAAVSAPTAAPTEEPTAVLTAEPTQAPTATPTAVPTVEPTTVPTETVTAEATVPPTATPVPTETPTVEPTSVSAAEPMETLKATEEPTESPTAVPTETVEPTEAVTAQPTPEPTAVPAAAPTETPEPSETPTAEPTSEPTAQPEEAIFKSGYAKMINAGTKLYEQASFGSAALATLGKGAVVYVSRRSATEPPYSQEDWLYCHFDTERGILSGYVQLKTVEPLGDDAEAALIDALKKQGNRETVDGNLLPFVDCMFPDDGSEPTAEPTAEIPAEPAVEPTAEPASEPMDAASTVEPSAEPAAGNSCEPTTEPTVEPTADPTAERIPAGDAVTSEQTLGSLFTVGRPSYPGNIAGGSSVTTTVSVTGGAGSYAYNWYLFRAVSDYAVIPMQNVGAFNNSWTFTVPNVEGVYCVRVIATDGTNVKYADCDWFYVSRHDEPFVVGKPAYPGNVADGTAFSAVADVTGGTGAAYAYNFYLFNSRGEITQSRVGVFENSWQVTLGIEPADALAGNGSIYCIRVIATDGMNVGFADCDWFYVYPASTITPAADFTYTLSDGAATITSYIGINSVVNIPDTIENLPVTTLGAGAFSGNTKLTSVTVPENVTHIGENAFQNCSVLTDVDLPAGLITLDQNAFANCDGLTAVTLPDSLKSIGNRAFFDCDGLQSIQVPGGITAISPYVFSGCDVLESVTLPAGLTTLGTNAFSNCPKLSSISVS